MGIVLELSLRGISTELMQMYVSSLSRLTFLSPGLTVEWGRPEGPSYIQGITPDP